MPTWKKSNPKHKAFNCSFAWHYRKSVMYLAVYYFIAGLTGWGERASSSSIQKVADYFDADYETVRRVFKQLVRGWLKPDVNDRRKLWLVKHNEWGETHKNACVERAVMQWSTRPTLWSENCTRLLKASLRSTKITYSRFGSTAAMKRFSVSSGMKSSPLRHGGRAARGKAHRR